MAGAVNRRERWLRHLVHLPRWVDRWCCRIIGLLFLIGIPVLSARH